MAVVCTPLTAAAEPAWDEFVTGMPAGTFFHLSGWRRVISSAFGHQPCYVMTERDGAITGVLPMFLVKSVLFGRRLMSSPFCVYGGPLAADDESEAALTRYAEEMLDKTGASAVEFRHSQAANNDWVERSALYATFRKRLLGDEAANLAAIPRKQRAMVRKGIQNGLTSVVDATPARLWPLYAESVRNLGTPVFARRYFDILSTVFYDDIDIVTVLDGTTPIASVMSFYFRDEVLPYYAGSTPAARGRAAHDFMYWEVMRRALANGARLFDFGRSKVDTGAFAFKKNWGFDPSPLPYRYKTRAGAAIPEHNPTNPKYRLMIRAWKTLPLAVANRLGPSIVKGIG